MSAVEAAQVAQGCFWRADFEKEVMAGNLRIIRNTEVAIFHATKQEGIVLGEGEGLGGAV